MASLSYSELYKVIKIIESQETRFTRQFSHGHNNVRIIVHIFEI